MASTLQQDRRRDATPTLTWEPWALGLAAIVAVWAYGVQAARGTANYFAGAGFTWPPAQQLFKSLPGVLNGHAGAGLPRAQQQHLASPPAVWAWIAAMSLAILALLVATVVVMLKRRVKVRGLATRAELEKSLGRAQALKAAKELRPDLSRRHVRLADVAVHVGCSCDPAGVEIFVRSDRTLGVIGQQGSGKTLDLLVPALLEWKGSALVTLTKPNDMYLSWAGRAEVGPCMVLDPFGITPGLPELVWDPVAGCEDPMIAQRRAKAFCAGSVLKSTQDDSAAKFYAAEAAKVLQGWFHAAALSGGTIEDVTQWAADPTHADEALEVLRQPNATPYWAALVNSTLTGDADTVGNTISTLQSALALFFLPEVMRRCVPGPGRPATDIAELISQRGTIYLVGREDPYVSVSPLMTALTEHVLDTALDVAHRSPFGRLTPGFHAFLDELPSTAPIPTLASHMANDRALGLSFSLYMQNPRQGVRIFGRDGWQEVWDLINCKVIFGGLSDVEFARDVVALLDQVAVTRRTTQRTGLFDGGVGSDSIGTERIDVLTVGELRKIPEGQALVLYSRTPAFLVKLRRCIDGRAGKKLLQQQAALRDQVAAAYAASKAPAATGVSAWTSMSASDRAVGVK